MTEYLKAHAPIKKRSHVKKDHLGNEFAEVFIHFSENFLNYSLKHRFKSAFVLPLIKVSFFPYMNGIQHYSI